MKLIHWILYHYYSELLGSLTNEPQTNKLRLKYEKKIAYHKERIK